MENKDKMIKNMNKKYKELTPPKKRAIYWIVTNIEAIGKIIKGEEISENEMDKYIDKATEKEDYVMLVLLLFKQRI